MIDAVEDEAVSDESGSDDEDSGSDGGDESSGDPEAGFGDFISGTIAFSGPEEANYTVGDPGYDFVGGGGCSGDSFGVSINAREADSGFTAFQLGAEIDADLNGGGTGTFDVEEVSLLAVTDGDLTASRTYEGPGTMSITEHDTGGADFELNERRMALTIEGTLEATGANADGTVDVSADPLWIMGCP